MFIRPAKLSDLAPLLAMLQASGQFDPDAILHVQQTFESYFAGESEELWLCAEQQGLAGVAYCAPEAMANNVWNLLMLWVSPCHQRQGIGQALVNQIEKEMQNKRARLLLVETSSSTDFSAARAFYSRQGFIHEATIRDYYDENEDKLVFTKNIPS